VTLPQLTKYFSRGIESDMKDKVFGSDERKGTVTLPQLTKYFSRVIESEKKI
jgi:hypothetical protein